MTTKVQRMSSAKLGSVEQQAKQTIEGVVAEAQQAKSRATTGKQLRALAAITEKAQPARALLHEAEPGVDHGVVRQPLETDFQRVRGSVRGGVESENRDGR